MSLTHSEVVADTIKDIYRDLLSSNDRALNNNPENQSKNPSQNTYITNYGGDDDSKKKEKTQVAFKGKLSIGVDEHSNTLLVSTEGENLYKNVSKMIEELDRAAIPASSVQVHRLEGTVDAEKVGKALQQILKKQQPPAQQGQHG